MDYETWLMAIEENEYFRPPRRSWRNTYGDIYIPEPEDEEEDEDS